MNFPNPKMGWLFCLVWEPKPISSIPSCSMLKRIWAGFFLFFFIKLSLLATRERKKKKKKKRKKEKEKKKEEEFSSSFLKGQLKSYTWFLFYEEVIRGILHQSVYIHWFSFFWFKHKIEYPNFIPNSNMPKLTFALTHPPC